MKKKLFIATFVASLSAAVMAQAGGFGFASDREANVVVIANGEGGTNCSSPACKTTAGAAEKVITSVTTSPRATGLYDLVTESGGFGFASDNMFMATQLQASGSVVADASQKPASASSSGQVLVGALGAGDEIVGAQEAILIIEGEATDTPKHDFARGAAGAAVRQEMSVRDRGHQTAEALVDTFVSMTVKSSSDH